MMSQPFLTSALMYLFFPTTRSIMRFHFCSWWWSWAANCNPLGYWHVRVPSWRAVCARGGDNDNSLHHVDVLLEAEAIETLYWTGTSGCLIWRSPNLRYCLVDSMYCMDNIEQWKIPEIWNPFQKQNHSILQEFSSFEQTSSKNWHQFKFSSG